MDSSSTFLDIDDDEQFFSDDSSFYGKYLFCSDFCSYNPVSVQEMMTSKHRLKKGPRTSTQIVSFTLNEPQVLSCSVMKMATK